MKAKIENLKIKLQEAREQEQSITDKYSTNYKEWTKACNKVSRIQRQVNKLIREYNFNNGSGYNLVIQV